MGIVIDLFVFWKSLHLKKNRSLFLTSKGTILFGGQGVELVTFRHLFNGLSNNLFTG